VGWFNYISQCHSSAIRTVNTHTHTHSKAQGGVVLSLANHFLSFLQTDSKKKKKHKTAKSKTYGHRSPITLSMKHPEKCNDAKNIKTIIICTVIVVIVIIMRLDKIT